MIAPPFPGAMAAVLSDSPRRDGSGGGGAVVSSSPTTGDVGEKKHQQYGHHELAAAVDYHSSGQAASGECTDNESGSSSKPGPTLSSTSSLFNVPRSTLAAHVAARKEGKAVNPTGHPPALDAVDEKAIADWVRYCAFVNLPVLRAEILDAAMKLASAGQGISWCEWSTRKKLVEEVQYETWVYDTNRSSSSCWWSDT
jgi:hypothetical protein